MAALVAKLLVTVKVLGGYPVPAELPSVRLVPDAELSALACRGECRAQAIYLAGRGILLSDRLDPVRDLRARSVLLHELVHYAQDLHGKFATLEPCERFRQRESEAYAVQNRFLRRHGLVPVALVVPPNWLGGACAADGG